MLLRLAGGGAVDGAAMILDQLPGAAVGAALGDLAGWDGRRRVGIGVGRNQPVIGIERIGVGAADAEVFAGERVGAVDFHGDPRSILDAGKQRDVSRPVVASRRGDVVACGPEAFKVSAISPRLSPQRGVRLALRRMAAGPIQ
ncbi:hypothetical protein I0D68_20080 [Pseudomonas lalucatii]|nr:hypothetical protein I0D68_20080 [Pseudomonas lalucatii]